MEVEWVDGRLAEALRFRAVDMDGRVIWVSRGGVIVVSSYRS